MPQYAALIYVPRTSAELPGFGQGEVSLQLYVKRVLIDAENKDLLPRYLRFARGVVESEDLPLNVSRETLQENRLVFKIRETLTRKLLDALIELSENEPGEYATFWKAQGRLLKEGYSDFANRERFQKLLRFNSSHHDNADELTSLRQYAERMKEGQKGIYYLSGPSREALERDPRLELFRKKGAEVLYLYDLADEFVLGSMGKLDERDLVSTIPEDFERLETSGRDHDLVAEVLEHGLSHLADHALVVDDAKRFLVGLGVLLDVSLAHLVNGRSFTGFLLRS